MDKNDLKAIELLSDWTKWIVTVEAALIGFMSYFAKDGLQSFAYWPKVLVAAAFILFTVSIITASLLLQSLPATAQRLPPPPGKDIYHMGTFEGTRGIRVYVCVTIQSSAFVIGVACISAALVINMLSH